MWGLLFVNVLGNTQVSQIKIFANEISKECLHFKFIFYAQKVLTTGGHYFGLKFVYICLSLKADFGELFLYWESFCRTGWMLINCKTEGLSS